MQTIPLKAVPAQYVTVQLGGQICQITLQQKAYGLFLDLRVNNALVVAGVLCQNLNRVVRSAYLGFVGDLYFVDTQGSSDPDYTGLEARFVLTYLDAADLLAA